MCIKCHNNEAEDNILFRHLQPQRLAIISLIVLVTQVF